MLRHWVVRRVEHEAAGRIAVLEQLRHSDRVRTVGMLTSGVAHELGTPLSVISARAQMIASGKTAEAQTSEYGHIIGREAQHMAKIIRQLLAFARRKPMRKAPQDLRRVAIDTLELLRPLSDRNRVRLELRGDDIKADVDRDGIQQALTNIVVNAIHAMPHGGVVDVSMEYEARPPDGERPGPHAVVHIRDEGEGISKEDLPHIFEPFFTTKDVGSGTGLGLSITQGIVEDNGGWIDVQSDPAKGTTFSIHLPAVPR